MLALFGGFADLGVFRAAVVPVAGPAWFARVAVLVAIGAGVGMAATGVLRLADGDCGRCGTGVMVVT